jgi:hypothetical protein
MARPQEPPPRGPRPGDVTRRLVACLLLATVLAGCAAGPAPSVAQPDPIPIALPAPLREARTIPLPDGSIRIEAVSARAVANQPYLYAAFTHCGFTANTFDFDGSFWAIANGPAGAAAQNANPPAGIDNPSDPGVIALVEADRAVWISRGGIRLELARGPNKVKVFGCD